MVYVESILEAASANLRGGLPGYSRGDLRWTPDPSTFQGRDAKWR